MSLQLEAKYIGCYAGKFKFEDNNYRTVTFPKCANDLIRKFELLSEKHVNQIFRIGFIYFDKQDIKIINELLLIEL
jgi:hypothetical protein